MYDLWAVGWYDGWTLVGVVTPEYTAAPHTLQITEFHPIPAVAVHHYLAYPMAVSTTGLQADSNAWVHSCMWSLRIIRKSSSIIKEILLEKFVRSIHQSS